MCKTYRKNMKNTTEPQLTTIGKPFDEGFAETIDPTTGRDVGDMMPGSIELYPIDSPNRDAGTSHDGDMGRLSK